MTVNRYFTVETDYRTGFQEHVPINSLETIDDSFLRRRRLFYRHAGSVDKGHVSHIKKIIDTNTSLRIGLGWSFESTSNMTLMFEDCYRELVPKFERHIVIPHVVSDFRGDWFGFVPYNLFEKSNYEDQDLYQLILYNNSLIDFQTDVVKFVLQHPTYRAHELCRNEQYRYRVFKNIRSQSDQLEDLTKQYLDALEYTTGLNKFPRELIEQDIGVHFLQHPGLFFELMDFYSLQGTIYE